LLFLLFFILKKPIPPSARPVPPQNMAFKKSLRVILLSDELLSDTLLLNITDYKSVIVIF
jgi:hypothetical protein